MSRYSDHFWEGDGFSVVIEELKTPKNVEFLLKFIKERSSYEAQSAKNLLKLNRPEIKSLGSTSTYLQEMKNQVRAEADAKTLFSENMKIVIKDIGTSEKEFKSKFKPHISEAEKLIKKHKSLFDKSSQSEIKYHKICREVVEAETKRDSESNPAKLAKLKLQVEKLQKSKDDASAEHKKLESKLNDYKKDYTKKMVVLMDKLQDIELERNQYFKKILGDYREYLSQLNTHMPESLEKLEVTLDKIDPITDMDLWIDQHKTGSTRPDGTSPTPKPPKSTEEKETKKKEKRSSASDEKGKKRNSKSVSEEKETKKKKDKKK